MHDEAADDGANNGGKPLNLEKNLQDHQLQPCHRRPPTNQIELATAPCSTEGGTSMKVTVPRA